MTKSSGSLAKENSLTLDLWRPDVTANCQCEIHCLVLDGFNLNTVHKLSSNEKKLGRAWIQTRGCWVGSKNASTVLFTSVEQPQDMSQCPCLTSLA